MASILVSLHSAPRGCEPVDTPGQRLSSFLWPCYPSLPPHFFLVQPYKSTKQQKQLNTGTQDSGTSQSPHLCGLLPPSGSAAMLLRSHCRTPHLWPRSSWVCLFCPLVKGSRCGLSSSSARQVAVPFTWSLSSELGCFSVQLGRQLRWDLLQKAQDSVSGDLSHAQLCH